MLATRNFIVPHLNYVAYVEKPPLLYWLGAMWMAVFGVNELAARLTPALAALAGVLMTWFFVRRTMGRGRALLAGAILTTSTVVRRDGAGADHRHAARSGGHGGAVRALPALERRRSLVLARLCGDRDGAARQGPGGCGDSASHALDLSLVAGRVAGRNRPLPCSRRRRDGRADRRAMVHRRGDSGARLRGFLFRRRASAPLLRVQLQPRRALLLLSASAGGGDDAVDANGAVHRVARAPALARGTLLYRRRSGCDRDVLGGQRQAHPVHPARRGATRGAAGRRHFLARVYRRRARRR